MSQALQRVLDCPPGAEPIPESGQGVEEWDKEGEPAYDPEALEAMIDEVRNSITVTKSEVDAHINDQAYADAVLAIVDGWIADGTLAMSV